MSPLLSLISFGGWRAAYLLIYLAFTCEDTHRTLWPARSGWRAQRPSCSLLQTRTLTSDHLPSLAETGRSSGMKTSSGSPPGEHPA